MAEDNSQGKREQQITKSPEQEGTRECVWNISEQIQGNTWHSGAKAEGFQRHCLDCVVLHNMLRRPRGGADRAPTTADEIASLQNEQMMHVPNDSYKNPSREAKH